MPDKMLRDENPTKLSYSKDWVTKLTIHLAECILDAEMSVYLSNSSDISQGNTRNGHNVKTVIIDSVFMLLVVHCNY